MPYFPDQYQRLTYPTFAGATGLYNAQLGAIHAVASHFTLEDQPAVVTMPTGSGKTAVLMMTPFVLKANRVLVITPSRLVREQISEDFAKLDALKRIGVVPTDLDIPSVRQQTNRIETVDDWEALRDSDVVVSTPNCTSPGYKNIPTPPDDLFDLLLIDEAHHSPAHTWAALLAAFPKTRKVLFTATPFRRDRGEIKGRIVYAYPVARAMADGIFGKIRYIPVNPDPAADNNDAAIAKAAESALKADRRSGLNHCLMVRTDRLTRASELARVYRENTKLRLEVVHSQTSSRKVKAILDQLDAGELDGIICVNMLGEGFNFPRLKIAAVHSPHRSLEVTLQFIGRFARTNAAGLGEAKFLAVPSEIDIEGRRLFEEGAMWQTLVQDLSQGRIAEELRIRETLEEFKTPQAYDAELRDLSLYSLNPRSHVKVYDTSGLAVHLALVPELPDHIAIAYRSLSVDKDVLVLLLRESVPPKWASGERILDTEHTLLVLFHDRRSQLLFVNSSKSAEGLYQLLKETFCPDAWTLSMSEIKRVVRDIKNQRIFNLGLRNLLATNTAESYLIRTGSDTQATIKPSDARQYRQGHVFLSGESGGSRVTIGYSSGSKVWATLQQQIPDLLDWCRALGQRIRNTNAVVTNSGLDDLSTGETVAELPLGIIHVEWDRDAFDFDPTIQVRYTGDDGKAHRGPIGDLDIVVDRAGSGTDRIEAAVRGDSLSYPITFTVDDWFTSADGEPGRIEVIRGNTSTSLIEYVNTYYPTFYTAAGGVLVGNEYTAPRADAQPIDVSQLEPWDWTGVDITQEVTAEGGLRSVHDEMRIRLAQDSASVALIDHGNGEIADFVTLTETDDKIVIRLFHCKGSDKPNPGARVEDAYEVCGQAQKSAVWRSIARLEQKLKQRGSRLEFIQGSATELSRLLGVAKNKRQDYEVVIVQPGFSRSKLSSGLAETLGATNNHLLTAGCLPLRVIASQ
jgi:superfamily II DNA or RNA helicase